MIHDSILGTIGNTPVVRINRLAPPRLRSTSRCEAFNPMSSVKDRLAIAMIEDAERRGVLKPGMTVIEPTSGNTGIALAMVCAAKGYPFVAIMSDSFSVERRKLMKGLGAKVILTPAAERGSGMVQEGGGAGEEARLVPAAAVREPVEPRVSPQHDRPRDPARLRRPAPRLLRERHRHRRHHHGRGRDAEDGPPRDQDRLHRAGGGAASSRRASGSPHKIQGWNPTSSRRSSTGRSTTRSSW